MARFATPVAALESGRYSQIADANVARQSGCDDFVPRGSAGAWWQWQPAFLPRGMGQDAAKTSRKLMNPEKRMPARAPRRSAQAGDYLSRPAGSSPPPHSVPGAAPQPLPQAASGKSQKERPLQLSLVRQVLAEPNP